MGSRHLQGTVFRRVKALLASGATKNKPVWFDVMAAFPPLIESKLSDVPEPGRPPVIKFKEDDIRDKFIGRFPILKKIPMNLLTNIDKAISSSNGEVEKEKEKYKKDFLGMPSLDALVVKYKEYAKTGIDSDAAISKTVEWVLSQLQDAKLKSTWAKKVQKLRKHDKALIEDYDEDEEDISDSVDIVDLFKLSKPVSKLK